VRIVAFSYDPVIFFWIKCWNYVHCDFTRFSYYPIKLIIVFSVKTLLIRSFDTIP
jgi:hypothetical protein